MSKRQFFVTGTGTDVGKTIISALLCRGGHLNHQTVTYWKPVQTGTVDTIDADVIETSAPNTKVHSTFSAFSAPLSPDQAAALEGTDGPRASDLARVFKESLAQTDNLVIEGAGGVLVPLNKSGETWIDLLRECNLSVIVVAHSGLGTLNHTSLTLDDLHNHGIHVDSVILNGPNHKANLESLQQRYPEMNFHHCKTLKKDEDDLVELDEAASHLYQRIFRLEDHSNSQNSLMQEDQDHCWHPYTQHKTNGAPLLLKRAKGIYLYPEEGEPLIDGTSSWWANTIGHGRPEIGAAIHRQQQTLDHTIFASATHPQAIKLSKRLSRASKGHLSRSFYTDNGSCAVEVALKIALQRAQNRGETHRTKFLSFQGAYHGDTCGAMSVGTSDSFHSPFSEIMFEHHSLAPVTAHPSSVCPDGPDCLEQGIKELEAFFTKHASTLAGVIIEPLIQGAAGMIFQHPKWTQALGEIANRHQVPLILDEVFTGLGRAAGYFAYEFLGLKPDLVCIAKGLTGGTLPLAVTLSTETIFQDFFSDDNKAALYHGHTYTANATACAAANATLDLYESLDLIGRSQVIESRFDAWLRKNQSSGMIENGRTKGAILAWECPNTGSNDYFSLISKDVVEISRQEGLFLRPLGNTIYFLPALTITDEELEDALSRIERLNIRLKQRMDAKAT